jgi:hypothetical protein
VCQSLIHTRTDENKKEKKKREKKEESPNTGEKSEMHTISRPMQQCVSNQKKKSITQKRNKKKINIAQVC